MINCKNRLRLAKVIVKNKMSRFFMVQCVELHGIQHRIRSTNHSTIHMHELKSFVHKSDINTGRCWLSCAVVARCRHEASFVHRFSHACLPMFCIYAVVSICFVILYNRLLCIHCRILNIDTTVTTDAVY